MNGGKVEMKLLTKEEAEECLAEAQLMVVEYRDSNYRFGQSLFNCLPVDLYHHFTGTEHDFFYWKDDDKVIETFYEFYVEKNDAN